ncbi:MAG: hypothetical protein IPK27_00505 [Rhodanobacteraceae bacterium]|nr:hypothetical protein [Rhodanobacteraceae bacterium]
MKTLTALSLALALVSGHALAETANKPGPAGGGVRVGTPIENPAATISYTGNSAGGPTWNRPAVVSASDCGALSGVGTATPYSAQPFYVDTPGNYDIFSDQGYGGGKSPDGGFDGYIVLYRDSFNPASPLTNCVGGDDDAAVIGLSEMLGVPLDGNRTYVLVTTGFSNGDAGEFENEITGPGNIVLSQFAQPQIAVDSIGREGLLLLGLLLGVAGIAAVRRYG